MKSPNYQLAQSRLSDFITRADSYEQNRGFIRDSPSTVSQLSPFIRYRFLHEREILQALLDVHSFTSVEKFVQELSWRTYWRGWLMRNPNIWELYTNKVNLLLADAKESFQSYEHAIRGETHLPYFNDWIHELKETGYLHNHVRMWFASIWYFTLQLPWELGAHWMYQHLLDGDPASNTLSWRWVVGLHTRGKVYLATPQNIHQFSEGRWSPLSSDLSTTGIAAQEETSTIVGQNVFLPKAFENTDATLPLILCREQLTPPRLWSGPLFYLDLEIPDPELKRNTWSTALLKEACAHYSSQSPLPLQDLIILLLQNGYSKVCFLRPQPGEHFTQLTKGIHSLSKHSIEVQLIDDPWDQALFPFAEKGFFPFWKHAKKWLKNCSG